MASTTTILRPGDVVGGFRVGDVIGIGGMAIVYRAEQISLGRPVALKVLSSKLTRDAVFRERFRREGKHAAALEHPNIVPMYDSGEYDGLLYLAMRLVEGTNLAELLETRGLTADQTIEVLTPIASALDTAHAAGLIHRDIKPQNVLMTAHGHPYLADFGVAKGSNTYGLTATGGFVGSVNYASPEQIKGLTLTPASDVYALTAVLYQCLTGTVPYHRESDAGIMHAHLHQPPPTLPTLRGADTDLHTVFARGMAKDPDARYGHAGDLLNAAALSVTRLAPEIRTAVPAFPADDLPETASPPLLGVQTDHTEIVAPEDFPRRGGVESHTTADRRRAPAVDPEPATAIRRARWQWLLGIGVAVIAAIALVAVLAGGGRGTQAVTLRRGYVELAYTGPWREATPPREPIDGLGLGNALALVDPHETLVAGALNDTASVPGSVPTGLASDPGAPQHGTLMHLRKIVAVAYDFGPRGAVQAHRILVIPTARGDLAVLCAGTGVSPDLSACLAIAQTLRVIGTEVVPPGADARLAGQLPLSVAPALAARAKASGLSASRVAVRVAAARGIAAADRRTVALLSRLSPQPRDLAMVGALGRAIDDEASALGALADAAARGEHPAYRSAVSAVETADKHLASARDALHGAGFTALPALRALAVPALPSVHRAAKAAVNAGAPAGVESGASSVTVSPAAASPAVTPAAEAPAASTPAPSHAPARSHRAAPVIEEAKPLH